MCTKNRHKGDKNMDDKKLKMGKKNDANIAKRKKEQLKNIIRVLNILDDNDFKDVYKIIMKRFIKYECK